MTSGRVTLLLDAHVHLHDCFDTDRFMAAVTRNFTEAAQGLESRSLPVANCLFCVDLQDRPFAGVLKRLGAVPEYKLLPVSGEEPHSRTMRHHETGFSVQIVWGYQIVTAENLEVLAFGLSERVENGLPVREVLKQLESDRSGSAFGIVPWGFGKWLGSRGRLVEALLDERDMDKPLHWFVGDNGARLDSSAVPSLIDKAQKQRGIWNIPGSDPLPFTDQVARAGSRGAILSGNYDAMRPRHSVRLLLQALEKQPELFGRGETLFRFAKAQVRMQIHKRF